MMTTAGRFICPHCAAEFDTQDLLLTHERQVHLRAVEADIPCPECEEKFATRQRLDEHIESHHTEREPL